MASTEEDFPRGGAVKKARGNNIDLQVEVDNLFEVSLISLLFRAGMSCKRLHPR